MRAVRRIAEALRGVGVARAARVALYALVLPPLAVAPFALKNPQRPARLATAVLLTVALAAILAPPARAWLVRAWERRSLLRAADALLWNAVVVIALAELTLTVASAVTGHPLLSAPRPRADWHVADVRKRMAERRGTDTLHRGGFNDGDWQVPKPPGVQRLLALGDSFAYGIVGYERNFLTALEPRLTDRVGGVVEVVNLGLPELNPIDYLYVLEREGLVLEPDAVLVCLYTGNDFPRHKEPSWLDVRRYRFYEFPRRTFLVLAERTRRARERRGDGRVPIAAPPGAGTYVATDEPTLSTDAYRQILAAYAQLLRSDPGADPDFADYIAATLGVLDRIVALAHPRPVAIAVIPSELQVDPALQEAVLADLDLPPGSLDLERPSRAVAEHFAGTDVLVVDLFPAIAAAHREAPAYHPRDTHWNARGNAVATEVLAEALAPWLASGR